MSDESTAPVLLVSFSGGRTSALMARMIQTSPIWEKFTKVYVFANTGREREETLKFVHECDRRWELGVVWVEAVIDPMKGKGTRHRVVNYNTAIRNTDPPSEDHPFIALVAKYGLPSNAFPHCTRELKLNTIGSYMRSLGHEDYITAIGIRADERRRVQSNPDTIYPLVDMWVTEEMVRTFWDRQGFDLGLKDYEGNCDLCFKKSLRKRVTILRATPEIAPFWSGFEGPRVDARGRTNDLVFDRHGLSVKDLLALTTDTTIQDAVDKHDARLATENPQLFDILSTVDWDFEKPCHCESTLATEPRS